MAAVSVKRSIKEVIKNVQKTIPWCSSIQQLLSLTLKLKMALHHGGHKLT